jgi:hypothetical protein
MVERRRDARSIRRGAHRARLDAPYYSFSRRRPHQSLQSCTAPDAEPRIVARIVDGLRAVRLAVWLAIWLD